MRFSGVRQMTLMRLRVLSNSRMFRISYSTSVVTLPACSVLGQLDGTISRLHGAAGPKSEASQQGLVRPQLAVFAATTTVHRKCIMLRGEHEVYAHLLLDEDGGARTPVKEEAKDLGRISPVSSGPSRQLGSAMAGPQAA